MTATETRLEALQVERDALQANLRKLEYLTDKEKEIDLDSGTREENIRLSQTVTRLEAQREEAKEGTGQSVESTHETAALRAQLKEMASKLVESKRELGAMTTRAKVAEECTLHFVEDRERTKRGAELEVFRAVAKETKKWEQREARLVKRIDELESAKAKAELRRLHKPGFSLLSQTSSSGQTLGVQLATSAPVQNSTTGGIFKFGETPTAVTSTTATTSGVLTFSAEPAQQKPIFGGGLQQTQNSSGGLTLGGSGGIFGTPSTTASMSTLSSTATMGSEPVGKPTSTPTLNFGSSTTSSPQPQQVSAASLLFGGGSTAIGTVDFSGSAGQAGSTLGASGSSTGLNFGAGPPAQGARNVLFNFSAGSNPTTGGLNFGNPMVTPGNQASSTPTTGVFGSQMPTGGLFGQTNNSSAGGGGSGTLFNPSQTTPSNPAPQQPFGDFNFTPQPSSTSGFGTPGGNFGSLGVEWNTLLS